LQQSAFQQSASRSEGGKKSSKKYKKPLTPWPTPEIVSSHTVTKITKMRTKTLLAVGAALAAGVVASLAQSNVYSLNIVGYVNKTIVAGNAIYANPLSNGNNSASIVLSGISDGTIVNLWTGTGFDSYYFETGLTGTGWATDSSGAVELQPPVLPPGKGFFVNPGASWVQTFVGEVVPGPGKTNSPVIAAGNQLIGTVLPVGGSVTNAGWNFPLQDGIIVNKWVGNGYSSSYYENGLTGTGWATDSSGAVELPAPSFEVAEGFFYNSAGVTWQQTLP
jgi:hypothetical protein